MLKFILISLAVWFVITRLMKFKFVVYKGGDFRNYPPKKPEGSVTIDNASARKRAKQGGADGEYVDYEEVK